MVSTTQPAPSIKVLLVDDNVLFLKHFSRWLESRPCIAVVGQAFSGQEAITLFPQLRPDVVLVDIGMKPMNGFQTVRHFRRAGHSTRIVLMASDPSEASVEEVRLYCDGVVEKDMLCSDLIPLLARLFPGHRLQS